MQIIDKTKKNYLLLETQQGIWTNGEIIITQFVWPALSFNNRLQEKAFQRDGAMDEAAGHP